MTNIPDLPDGLENVDAYIAAQEDASGMPEMIAAHFAADPSAPHQGQRAARVVRGDES